jgi:hypothetical protein
LTAEFLTGGNEIRVLQFNGFEKSGLGFAGRGSAFTPSTRKTGGKVVVEYLLQQKTA